MFPDKPFEYRFLGQAVKEQYDGDRRKSAVLMIFAVVSIFISCMGLLTLTALTTEQRAKEISIRKVSGAGTLRLVFLLSKELVVLVLIGICIASPATYMLMNNWLEQFAYRISLDAEFPVFIVAAIGMFMITLATVAFHTSKAALANPVKNLRSE